MPQNQNINPVQSESFQNAVGCLFVIFVSIAIIVSYIWAHNRFSCVVAPNGVLIGRLTPFAPYEGIEPKYAIRKPNGELIIYGTGDILFWSKSGFAGSLSDQKDERIGPFVYLNDTGLILKDEKSDLYEQAFERALPKKSDDGIHFTTSLYNYFVVFKGLRKLDASSGFYTERGAGPWTNPRSWCPVNWF